MCLSISRKKSVKNRVEGIAEKIGIYDLLNEKVTYLSGGEKQRVAIARALINNPEIILADEPTGSLDSKSGKRIIDILVELNKEGKTLIIVTHDDKLASLAPGQIIVSDGKVLQTCS